MKFRAKEMKSKPGHYAVFYGKKFYTNTVTTDKREAEITALHMTGQWHDQQILEVEAKLRKLGALNENDPRGYLC